MSNPKIEVLIPTLNEAAHIESTVANAKRVGPVFVLDSGSTDGTQEAALRAGAQVVEHPFEGLRQTKKLGVGEPPIQRTMGLHH